MASTSDKTNNVHEGHRQRLRERFLSDRDMKTFRDHEILEYLLSLVIPRKDTNVLAHDLIHRFGSLNGVFAADPDELKRFKNMTTSASYMLASVLPAVRRSLRTDEENRELPVLQTAVECAEYLRQYFYGRANECMALLYLNARYQPVAMQWIEGFHPDRMKIDEEDIVRRAIKAGAKFVVMAHNHPSSRMEPSDEDVIESIKLYQFLRAAGMRLNDSIIVSDNGYFSLRNMGFLSKCENEWFAGASGRKELKEGAFFNPGYKSKMREYILDAITFEQTGKLVAVLRDAQNGDDQDPKTN